MNCYYCIVSLPAEPVADLCVLNARNDEDALSKAHEVAGGWSSAASVSVYCGERLIGLLDDAFRQAA